MDMFTQKGRTRPRSSTLTDTTRAILHDTLDKATTEEIVGSLSSVDLQLKALTAVTTERRPPRPQRIRYLMSVRAILVNELNRRTK